MMSFFRGASIGWVSCCGIVTSLRYIGSPPSAHDGRTFKNGITPTGLIMGLMPC